MIVWGINTHCDRVSVAVLESDDRTVLCFRTAKAKAGSTNPELRLWQLHNQARAMFDEIADEHPPSVVLIEQPRGARNGQDVLLAGWAAATIAAVTAAQRTGGRVEWVEIGTWRKVTQLYDRLQLEKHDKLTDRWKAAGLKMAREHGYSGRNTEESDAVVIGLAACQTADHATVTDLAA
jgi:hypothetical protein